MGKRKVSAERDAATDQNLADGVRTGLNVARAIVTGAVFLWIAFWLFIAALVVPNAGIGGAIAFSILIVPAALYAKRSVRLLLEKDRQSIAQRAVHDIILANQKRLDVQQGMSPSSQFSTD